MGVGERSHLPFPWGTGGRKKGMGVGERGHLPFPFRTFLPLSLPFPFLRLAQASTFCKIFSRLNRRVKVWLTGWYSWLSSVRFSVGYFFRLRSGDRIGPEETNFNILHLYKFRLGCEAWGTEEMYYSEVIKIVFKFLLCGAMSSNKLFLSISEFRPRPQTVPVLNRRKGHAMTVGYMKRFYHKFWNCQITYHWQRATCNVQRATES